MLDSVTPPSLLAPHEQRPATFTPLQMLMASPDAASSLSQSIPVAGDRLVRGWRVGDLLVWREHGHLAWWLRLADLSAPEMRRLFATAVEPVDVGLGG